MEGVRFGGDGDEGCIDLECGDGCSDGELSGGSKDNGRVVEGEES